MQIDVYDTAGQVVAQTELNDSVWGIEPNIAVMHQALVRQLANARQGTHETKRRGDVSGGGRKPWRQKGTGRARQGSTRAPQWVGGGVVWGPHPRSYRQRMPRKMRRLAIRSALSAKVRDARLTVVQGLETIEPRTRTMKGILEKLPAARSVLIVTPEAVEPVRLAAGNLPDVATILAPYLNVRDVLKYERLVVTPAALTAIERLWALTDEDQAAPARRLRPAAAIAATPPVTAAATATAPAAVEPAPAVSEPAEAPAGVGHGTGSRDCPDGYPIKGNASSMIYHQPGERYYKITVPELCFATEGDALAAGYRPYKHAAAEETAVSAEPAAAAAGAIAGAGAKECPEGYPIKGNANSMIYHQPGERYYNVTVPEMCFATEADAVAAGYRPYKHAAAEEEN